jgi:hypothetical protein
MKQLATVALLSFGFKAGDVLGSSLKLNDEKTTVRFQGTSPKAVHSRSQGVIYIYNLSFIHVRFY